MLDVHVPSLLIRPRPGPRSKPPRADDADDDEAADSSAVRVLTCALAGLSNLLVFAFVSLLGAWAWRLLVSVHAC